MDKKGEQSKEGTDMKLTVCCKSFSILDTGRSLLENISYAALNVNRQPKSLQVRKGNHKCFCLGKRTTRYSTKMRFFLAHE